MRAGMTQCWRQNWIREFGFTNPVLIDAEDGIIAGHGRVMAARKLAMSTVPCLR
ncbi:ParB N-terminal domain-containing protein, partial [Bacillus mobilis]|uniref:ParB N-terminal domain-containing protein n=1 Tax=Bacillus mobilis TaxID=2026190 RepID=UPI003AFFE330